MQLFRQKTRDHPVDLERLDLDQLPILDAQALIRALGQSNRLRTIRRLAAVGEKQYEALYQQALDRFCEAAQLQPASTVDHHAGLGGLIVHTLDVIERALRSRKQYLLPQNAGPERISEEEHAWTYGVFAGALLHDAGKLLTLTRLLLDGRHPWTPQGPALSQTKAKTYRITFIQAPYALQSRASGSLFHLLPAIGRDLLAQNSEILTQLMAWLYNDAYEWGAIGDILRKADGASVAENRKAGGERERLPNAQAAPLVERLMRALRQLIYDGELKFNRSGAAGWVEGACTYLVCGTAATAVAGRLRQEGSTDVPTDNVRLFDIWQDHGYAIPTEGGKAVWNLTVIGSDYRHELSMLKFETHRLFHPSRRPGGFDGQLVQRDGPLIMEETAPASQPEGAKEQKLPQDEMGQLAPEAGSDALQDDAAKRNEDDAGKLVQHEVQQEQPETAPLIAPPTPRPAEMVASGGDGATFAKTIQTAKPPESLKDPAIGQHFLSWVRAGVGDGGLKVNRRDAKVHIVPEGVLLVTPAIFKAYLQHYGFASSGEDGLNQQFKQVQARVQKLRLHRKTKTHLNIFKYGVKAKDPEKYPEFSASIRGWLFPPSVIYGDAQPPDANRVLEIQSELDVDS